MARPTKADIERKSNMLRIRMSGDDRDLLDALAKSEGLDTSTWARMALLRIAKRRARTMKGKGEVFSPGTKIEPRRPQGDKS